MKQIDNIKKAIKNKKIEFQKHAIKRLIEEDLTIASVLDIIINGELIKEYSDDKPYPSILILGYYDNKPVHVVCSYNHNVEKVHIITNYKPSLDFYEPDFKTRRKQNE